MIPAGYSATDHIASGLLPSAAGSWVSLSKITAYYDASGSEPSGGYLEVAGVVSPSEAWAVFDMLWPAALKKHGVEEFHFKDFKATEGAFSGWSEDRRRALMADLLEIFEGCVWGWYTFGLKIETFHQVAEVFDLSRVSPLTLAALFAQRWMEFGIDRAREGHPVVHFFEAGDTVSQGDLTLKLMGFEEVEKWNEARGYVYPFQAADLAAGELRTLRYGYEENDPRRIGRYPFTRLIQVPGMCDSIGAVDLMVFCQRAPHLFPRRVR